MVPNPMADDATDESGDDLTATAEWAVELSKRAGDGHTKSPVRMAFDEASNDEDTVSVRFTANRTGGVDFRIATAALYEPAYKPDHIVAEHFGAKAAIDDAFDVLRAHADLRSVRESRVGAIRFDRDTGDVVDISLFAVDVDDHAATVAEMKACFDDAGSDE